MLRLVLENWRVLAATAVVIVLCDAYAGLVLRLVCFVVSLFLALLAFAHFEHAVLFREKWRTATTGKRRTPPGQSVIAGLVFLALAILSMLGCFHH